MGAASLAEYSSTRNLFRGRSRHRIPGSEWLGPGRKQADKGQRSTTSSCRASDESVLRLGSRVPLLYSAGSYAPDPGAGGRHQFPGGQNRPPLPHSLAFAFSTSNVTPSAQAKLRVTDVGTGKETYQPTALAEVFQPQGTSE
ncbi:hypothetical protein MKZ38_006720 [Zalerion maritima]|uniref:Uncharacterized protein n=1 Tax=Zalerion maritima TaxID=339359 RepID=A0AAD5RJP7_9PEZI|nr:hypothetical protein MKZ38_006720 [Zalerion maritima]